MVTIFCYRVSTWENLSSGVCEQHRRRPAWASAQTDQPLCYSLTGKYHILTCFKRNFNVLDSLCSWGDWFESRSVRNCKDRFCHDEAHKRGRTEIMSKFHLITEKIAKISCWFFLSKYTAAFPTCIANSSRESSVKRCTYKSIFSVAY